MLQLREVEEHVIKNGRVVGQELRLLRSILYADRRIDRREADFLVELHKRVPMRSKDFEQFFYGAIKKHILADNRIGNEETEWLAEMLFHDNKIDDEERRFLRELKGEANQLCPAFEALYNKCMQMPPAPHTSG